MLSVKIGLDDDPLAFLGVLVDGLQEWDRYKVARRGEAAFSGKELLQSIEVGIWVDSNTIHLKYPDPKRDNERDWGKDITNTMDNCLERRIQIVKTNKD